METALLQEGECWYIDAEGRVCGQPAERTVFAGGRSVAELCTRHRSAPTAQRSMASAYNLHSAEYYLTHCWLCHGNEVGGIDEDDLGLCARCVEDLRTT